MIFIYKLITILLYPFIPLYLRIRILNNKEDVNRINERYGIASQKKKEGKLIWFHAASIGESLSIITLIKEIQKKNSSQILVTTGTKSSAQLIKQKLNKKITHQFIPLDNPLFIERFLSYWRPSIGIFVESEIWPNLILKSKEKKIKLIIINGRMTSKTFKRWSVFSSVSRKIFSCFDDCFTQNNDSLIHYQKLGVNKACHTGNLKFTSSPNKIDVKAKNKIKKIFEGRKIFVAASTHPGEEDIILDITKEIRSVRKEFISVIIPRHPNRKSFIKNQVLEKVILRSQSKKIKKDTSIYIADTLGELELFYSIADFIFIGGSFVNHGGQNPIEASYYGKLIHHGKFIQNFTDVYSILKKSHITKLVKSPQELVRHIQKNYDKPKKLSKKNRLYKLNLKSQNILKKNISLLNKYLP